MMVRSDGAEEALWVPMQDQERVQVSQWLPKDPSQMGAVVVILHGMAEHHLRYQNHALTMNLQGIGVYAYSHRGHGNRIHGELTGHFSDRNGWDKVIGDAQDVLKWVRKRHPQTPLLLMGHSMGSFIAQSVMLKEGSQLNGVILSGSSMMNPLVLKLAKKVAQLESLRGGPYGKSPVIDFLSFGSFNHHFKPNRTSFDWLSRDPKQVDLYLADPLCGFKCTNQLWVDFFGGLIETFDPVNRRAFPADVPVYIFGGSSDPVGGEKGLTQLASNLKDQGVKQVDCVIYPHGRHEMLNELNSKDVVADLITWILRHASASDP